MTDYVLDDEEQEILAAFEVEELKSIPMLKKQLQQHRHIAAATLQQDKKVNIRLTSRDLLAIQKIALTEGISYQALIASLVHKFVDGRLIVQ